MREISAARKTPSRSVPVRISSTLSSKRSPEMNAPSTKMPTETTTRAMSCTQKFLMNLSKPFRIFFILPPPLSDNGSKRRRARRTTKIYHIDRFSSRLGARRARKSRGALRYPFGSVSRCRLPDCNNIDYARRRRFPLEQRCLPCRYGRVSALSTFLLAQKIDGRDIPAPLSKWSSAAALSRYPPPEKSNIIQIRFFGVAGRFWDIKRADMTSKTGKTPASEGTP